jgi:hypothetical protein
MNNQIIINNIENERLTSVSFDLGSTSNSIESILENKENTLQKPLNGILKKSNSNEDNEIGLTVIKTCLTIFLLLLLFPIVFCDLYFGYNDTTCINSKSNDFSMSMKLYLLVSGFVGVGIIIILITAVCLISNEDKNNCIICCISLIGIFAGLFQFIWNILGGIVFWGTVYKEGTCSEPTSSYIFVSLILKLLGNFMSIMYNSFN